MTKNHINELIAKANIDEVFGLLKNISKQVEKERIPLSARWEKLKKQHRQGVIEESIFKVEEAKIIKGLIEIVEESKLPENSLLELESKLKDGFSQIQSKLQDILEEIETLKEQMQSREPEYTWNKDFAKDVAGVKKKWSEQYFQVAIVALVKSGKSTLLNAWIGGEYLPSATVAETMRVVRVRHNPLLKEGQLFQKQNPLASGVDETRTYLRQLNKTSRDTSYLHKNDEIRLEVNLQGLSDQPLGEYGFDILDTPGTNESGISALKAKVERLLKNVDVVVYLLDYTKLKQEDEKEMFNNLRTWREGLIKDLSKRMFFAVNKIDMSNRHDIEQKLGRNQVKSYVRRIIEKQISGAKLTEDEIYLVSAEDALLGRLILSGNYSESQFEDFKRKAFGEFQFKKIPKEMVKEAAEYFIEKSGLTTLERGVLANIYNNRTNIFFSSILDDLERIFSQIENNLEIGRKSLKSDKNTINGIKRKISNTQAKLDNISFQTNKFKKKAKKLIVRRFDSFQEQINDSIFNVFSDDDSVKSYNLIFPRAITDFLKTTKLAFKSTNRSEVKRKVEEMNKKIFEALDSEFESFWNEIIEIIYNLFEEFSESLYKEINPLQRKIEKVIEEELDIVLNPISIKPPRLKYKEFYNQIQNQIDEFIYEDKKFKPKVKWKKTKGLKVFGFWIIKPGKVKVPSVTIWETKFYASSGEYQKRLKEQIEPIIEHSIEVTNLAIDKQFVKAVVKAQKQLETYSEKYIEIMESEITKIEGDVNVTKRINESTEDLNSVKKISKKIKNLSIKI